MQHRTLSPTRRSRQAFILLTVLAIITLALAACGGREATPEAAATPTLIPTLASLEPAAAAPAQPTATPEPAATEAAGAESAAIEEAGAITETAPLTATEELTAGEEVTAGQAVTGEAGTAEEATEGAEMTATEEVTASAELTTGEAITATEAVSTGEEITGVTGAEHTHDITATEEVTSAEEVTSTEEITTTPEASATDELTSTEEATASEAVTGTEAVTETAALTETEEAVSPLPSATPSAAAATDAATDATAGAETEGEARVFFLQPTTNAIIPITSTVVLGYTGVEVQPAGETAEGAGHLHLLVDSDFIEAGQPMPADATHLHLADGSAETELVLTPGSHILRLQFADSTHISLEGEQYRDAIFVNVVPNAPEESVRFAMPTDGAVVPPTFDVVMAASGLSIEPSGAVREDAGHLHILVDEDFVTPGEIIPDDETHLHFGAAQLTGTVTLEPGEHTLRLQFADGEHRALEGDQYQDEIAVTVEEDADPVRVRFTAPEDGATVTAPFTLAWAATGVIIESAGQVVRPEGGHLHLLINGEFVPAGQIIPTGANSLHFGRGQTSAELDLNRGEYTFRLQMADGAHVAKDGAHYQDEITITVQ